MASRKASSFNVVRLEELIRNYINLEDNSIAKSELTNMILGGEDLIDALDILGFETEKDQAIFQHLFSPQPSLPVTRSPSARHSARISGRFRMSPFEPTPGARIGPTKLRSR